MEAEEISVEEAQKIIASHEQLKHAKDKKARKDAPKPEEVRSAVAAVVLAELEMWPEEIQSLIGDKHPQKESFEKGVQYIIGAYMKIAADSLKERVRSQIREAEVKAAKELGPLSAKISELRTGHREGINQAVHSLEVERARKLKEARDSINREYQGKIAKAKNTPIPEELPELEKQDSDIKEAFELYELEVKEDGKRLREQIDAIDSIKEKWNSKNRKAKRLEHAQKKGDAQPEVAV